MMRQIAPTLQTVLRDAKPSFGEFPLPWDIARIDAKADLLTVSRATEQAVLWARNLRACGATLRMVAWEGWRRAV